jgi:CHAT domain-containing protein/Tfp pilus assembly protein PilF
LKPVLRNSMLALLVSLTVAAGGTAYGQGSIRADLSNTLVGAHHTGTDTIGTDASQVNPEADSISAGIFSAQTAKEANIKVVPLNPVMQVPNFEIPKTPETIDKVVAKENQAEKYFDQHMLEQALASWQEAYGLALEMKYAEGEGRALTNMARVFLERGQSTKAKYLAENAIEVLADLQDKKDLGKARVQLARAYFGLNNRVWAGEQLDSALKLLTAADGTSTSPEAADAMVLAGSILVNINKMKEALQYYESAANYYVQAGDQAKAISTRVTIASMLDEFGYYTASMEESNKAISIARAYNHPVSTVTALASVGMSQYCLCEYANAKKSYEDALKIAQTLSSREVLPGTRGYIDLGYGTSLAATGDLEAAQTVLERSIPPLKSIGSMHGQAEALNVLGNIQLVQGQPGKAVAYLNQALDMQQMIMPKQPKLHVIILQNLAAAESRSGDNRGAKAHLETVLSILKTTNSTLLAARTYCGLAEVAMKLSDPEKAEAYTREAITGAEKIDDDASLWRDYTMLAKLQIASNDLAGAKESIASALSHFRSPQAMAFPCPERLGFPTSRADMGEQLVAMVAKMHMGEQALLTAEQLKEEEFNGEWHQRGGQVKPEDRDVYTELTLERAHLYATESSTRPDTTIKDWQQWLTRFRSVISENRPLARLVAPVPYTAKDVLSAAKANNTTFLDYLVGADSSVVFTVEPSSRITATVLPVTRKQLQSQVTALLTPGTTSLDQQRTTRLLQALYTELLPQGLRGFLPKSPDQTLAIFPDSVLYNLPFAALMDAQGRFFVQEHTITMAPSIGIFLDNPPRYADEFSVVVANSPAGQNGEANMISSMLPPQQVTRFNNPPAVGTLQEQVKGKSTVHFANNIPMSSNPMTALIGLLPDKEEAGRKVTANRLFGMTLPNDLFVFSGTSVNTKDVQGVAVNVVSRGLSYAGVRNVLMSLWVEPDANRTAELMDFYKNKQAGMTQAQSLRKAQLVALSRDPSPRSWAAYQLFGPGF